MSKARRITIVISPETEEVYKRMAKAGGLSVGKCIGEWLSDTADAALFTSAKMEEARSAPTLVLNQLMAINARAQDELLAAKNEVRGVRDSKPSAAARGLSPPSSNTGVYGEPRRTPK